MSKRATGTKRRVFHAVAPLMKRARVATMPCPILGVISQLEVTYGDAMGGGGLHRLTDASGLGVDLNRGPELERLPTYLWYAPWKPETNTDLDKITGVSAMCSTVVCVCFVAKTLFQTLAPQRHEEHVHAHPHMFCTSQSLGFLPGIGKHTSAHPCLSPVCLTLSLRTTLSCFVTCELNAASCTCNCQ